MKASTPPWCFADELWARWMVAAREAWLHGDHRHAASLWNEALDVAGGFAANDPRRAASLDADANTAATGAEFRAALEAALEAWDNARSWIDTMAVAAGARSSLFHHRLETRHPGAYPDIIRRRHGRTLAAGRAGTQARQAALDGNRDVMLEALGSRCDAFGHRETGAAAMARRLGRTVGEATVDRFTAVPAKRRDDEARLHGAALLAPVLFDHPAIASARPR